MFYIPKKEMLSFSFSKAQFKKSIEHDLTMICSCYEYKNYDEQIF